MFHRPLPVSQKFHQLSNSQTILYGYMRSKAGAVCSVKKKAAMVAYKTATTESLERLRDEIQSIIHGDQEIDALRREIDRLRCELNCAEPASCLMDCKCELDAVSSAPPYPPFPPFPPYPPYPSFPPFPPYPQSCCLPAPCACAKCHAERALPEVGTTSPSSSSSIVSSSSSSRRPVSIRPLPSSSSSVYSTNIR
jgi:hypothetical protein